MKLLYFIATLLSLSVGYLVKAPSTRKLPKKTQAKLPLPKPVPRGEACRDMSVRHIQVYRANRSLRSQYCIPKYGTPPYVEMQLQRIVESCPEYTGVPFGHGKVYSLLRWYEKIWATLQLSRGVSIDWDCDGCRINNRFFRQRIFLVRRRFSDEIYIYTVNPRGFLHVHPDDKVYISSKHSGETALLFS